SLGAPPAGRHAQLQGDIQRGAIHSGLSAGDHFFKLARGQGENSVPAEPLFIRSELFQQLRPTGIVLQRLQVDLDAGERASAGSRSRSWIRRSRFARSVATFWGSVSFSSRRPATITPRAMAAAPVRAATLPAPGATLGADTAWRN